MKILDAHNIEGSLNDVDFDVDELIKGTEVSKERLMSILRHLCDKELLRGVLYINQDGDVYHFDEVVLNLTRVRVSLFGGFRDYAEKYMNELLVAGSDNDERVKYPHCYFLKGHNKLKFCVEVKGKAHSFFFSDDVYSRKSRFVLFLSSPEFGVEKTLESVFEAVRLKSDPDSQSQEAKWKIIENLKKDVNRTLKEHRSPLKFVWKREGELISMTPEKSGF